MFRTALFATSTLITANASADVISYADFSDTSGLAINGSAAATSTTDGDVMRLIPAAFSQTGSVFSDSQVEARKFSTNFSFRISEPGGGISGKNTENGGDGFAFVIQRAGSDALGSSGGGLGYEGINNSIAIEFDTWHNLVLNDPSQSHVGIHMNGSLDHAAGLPSTNITGPELDDGDQWFTWIDYDGTNLEVRLSMTDTRPIDAMLAYELDLTSILGQDTAHIGFSSAATGAYANHDILDWEYRGFVPSPSTALLLVFGAIGTTIRRR